jgi:hypothetical protein
MTTLAYLIYISISVGLIVWVGHKLQTHGRPFFLEHFGRDEALASSVSHLQLVGFYLVSIGAVTLTLPYGLKAETYEQLIEALSTKLGIVLVVLGVVLFACLNDFLKMRKRAHQRMEAAKAL